MGLNQGGSASKTYLTISDGKIAKKVKTEEQGAVKCASKDGSKTWWEHRYRSISGKIKSVQKKDSDMGFGSRLVIEIQDGPDYFNLEMPWSSRYSSGFFLTMPNIDVNKQIEFVPWMKEIDGKKKTMLYLRHEGEQDNIQWYWTKENPQGLPEMKKIRVKGTDVWDDTDRQDFFEAYLNDTFIKKLGAQPKVAQEQAESNDDLPF